MDCFISKITNIRQHTNADTLQLANVNNWQVVIGKDQWKENEECLFISPDATLPDNLDWATPYLRYTGKQNRVKIVNLRGEFSNGIVIKISEIKPYFIKYNGSWPNNEIIALTLGIRHYQPPIQSSLDIDSDCLPFGLSKTDEENYQNLTDNELHLGERALVTRKLDGCSATYIATPEGEYYICGRRFTYKPDSVNHYTIIGNKIKSNLINYAKNHNRTICVRGEITGSGINGSKINKDSIGELKFSIFNTRFPLENKNGAYGTDSHFITVCEELKLPHVPVLGEVIITKEFLKEYEDAPAENGEGIVINIFGGGHYKIKSTDYYSKLK